MKLKFSVGNTIRRIRNEQGMTVRQLEPAVSKGHLSAIERGLREPSLSMLENIADVFEITTTALMKEIVNDLDKEHPTP